MSGKTGKAHELLDEVKDLGKSHYVSPYDMAIIYLGLGEKDQTLAWLEKAYEEREGSLVYLNVEQTFDRIRSDPRFKDLVHRIGLPE